MASPEHEQVAKWDPAEAARLVVTQQTELHKFELEEKRLDNASRRAHEDLEAANKRIRNQRDHAVGIARDTLLTLTGLVVLGSALLFSASILMQPQLPVEAKMFASAFWGVVVGKALDFLFRRGGK